MRLFKSSDQVMEVVANSDARLDTETPPGFWPKVVSWVWDSDFYAKSPAERRLVFKMDCTILTIMCFGWLMKYIDQTNLANAYVSGLKEDLNMNGNQYTYAQVCFNVAFAIMQVPSNLAVLKVRPSYWLAGCEIGWMAFTFAQAGLTNTTQLYVFRLFIGLFEAAFQPVSMFLLGSWYTTSELAKRISIWFIAGSAGQAFSGYLQAAIYKTLDGHAGLSGWRWLYIICGIMTFPVAIATLLVLPDFPHNSRSLFFTDEERQLAKDRCARNGTALITGKIDFGLFKRVLTRWPFWVCVPTYIIYGNACQDPNYFGIWLKAQGVSVVNRNVFPSAMYLIGIPCTLFFGYTADKIKNRFLVCFCALVWACIPTGIIAVYPHNFHLMQFAFMMSFSFLITHVLYAWFNEICRHDAEERAVVVASCNFGFYVVNSWLPTVIFRQTDGPRFPRGFSVVFACAAASLPLFVLMKVMHDRQIRQLADKHRLESAEETSKTDEEGKTGIDSELMVQPLPSTNLA